jgi:hypothetical protein
MFYHPSMPSFPNTCLKGLSSSCTILLFMSLIRQDIFLTTLSHEVSKRFWEHLEVKSFAFYKTSEIFFSLSSNSSTIDVWLCQNSTKELRYCLQYSQLIYLVMTHDQTYDNFAEAFTLLPYLCFNLSFNHVNVFSIFIATMYTDDSQ